MGRKAPFCLGRRMTNSSQRAIVTGGAGFIGSHLVERLLADGHQVMAIDDFSSGSEANLAGFRDNPRFSLHRADIADAQAVAPVFAGVGWVFHLAALADIVPSIQMPLRYHRANVDGTAAVLEASRHHGVKRLVYAASSSGYGLPDVCPTDEEAPARPMYPYALTKHVGELYVRHWSQCYGLPTVCLRLFMEIRPHHEKCFLALLGYTSPPSSTLPGLAPLHFAN